MTITEYIKKNLTDKGMRDADADLVVGIMKQDDAENATRAMVGHWNDDTEGYQIQTLAVLCLSADRVALEWIDNNKPAAWFCPIFAPQEK